MGGLSGSRPETALPVSKHYAPHFDRGAYEDHSRNTEHGQVFFAPAKEAGVFDPS
jgi:hypothetical protein